MGVLASADWAFVAAGWTLAAAGAVLAVWALFWDRPRGRRRCPHCWYEMAGVPGLRCPECGWEARRERRLFRTRRRWRGAAIGCAVALAGVAHLIYSAGADGWWRLVPTAVIIWQLPEAGMEGPPESRSMWVKEMERRIADNRLRDWEWRWALQRTRVIRTRPKWHADEPVRVALFPPSWIDDAIRGIPDVGEGWTVQRFHRRFGAPGRERDQLIGVLREGTRQINLDVTVHINGRARRIGAIFGQAPVGDPYTWRDTIRVPVQIVPKTEPVILPASGDELDRAAALAINLSLRTTPAAGAILTATINRGLVPELDEVALGLLIEVNYCGDLVEVLRFEDAADLAPGSRPWNSTLVPVLTGLSTDELCSGRWTVRVRGDAIESLGDFDRPFYWAGEFDVNIADILTAK